ncbi:heavy metal-associated domain-containing protein [Streptosporangium canum]|uniref:heavy-metal-associated domain-containing protein n=1 Tax=Streptosporangium canum TaxID=324952 RepID=UPI00341CDBDC
MITVAYSLVAYQISEISPATCAHCLDSIRVELIQVPGIVGVELTPESGRVSVLTDGPVDERLILDALEAAGCEVKGG